MGTPARTIHYKAQWYLVTYFDENWEAIDGATTICEGLFEVMEAVKLWNDLKEGRLLYDEVNTPGLILTRFLGIEEFDTEKEGSDGEA